VIGGPNPFLIPGSRPGRPKPGEDPREAVPDAPPAPPVFLPQEPPTHEPPTQEPEVESGTRRVPRTVEPRPEPAPAAPTTEVPVEATILRPNGPGSDALPPPPTAVPGTRWRLLLPDGVEIPLDAALLLGREPVAPSGVRGARPIALRDPDKTVSKTHALLTPVATGVRVRDLHSSNGTTLVLPGGRAPVPAEGDVLVTQEAELELGRFRVRLAF
jgi:hypothetical protein